MALVLADRVRDTTTTTGTGTVTLSGTAPTGYQTFGTAIGNGNTTYYTINAGSQWEVGIGTYTAVGTTLSRDTVLASSSAGALVNFAVGTKDVFVTYPAEKSVNQDASGNVGIGTTAPNSKLEVYGGSVRATLAGASAATFRGYSMASDSTEFASLKAEASAGETRLTSGFTAFGGFTTFHTNGSERMRIDSGGVVLVNRTGASGYGKLNVDGGADITGGNVLLCRDTGSVGIGTASPQRPLHVAYLSSAVGAYSAVFQGQTGGYGAGVSFQSNLTGGSLAEMARITADGEDAWNTTASTQDAGLRFYTALDGTVAEKMRIDRNGSVGIGTSTMFDKLNVYGTAASISVDTPTSTDNNGFVIRSVNTERGSLRMQGNIGVMTLTAGYAGYGGILAINTNGSERMRIDTAGKVGIGTSAPWELLSVPFNNGIALGSSTYSFKIQRSSAGELVTTFSDTYDASTARIDFTMRSGAAAQNTPLSILGSGNVGIGTTAPASTAILDVQSTTKGVRFPNMTTTQKNAITPSAGTVVFDTTLSKLCVYTGAAWQTITSA